MVMSSVAVALSLSLAGLAAAAPPSATIEAENAAYLLKNYPPRALAAREQGRVGFRIDVDQQARVTSCEIVESSGYPTLDRETCAVITEHARFKPTRDAEGRAVDATHIGYMSWKLPEGTAAAPRATGTQLAAARTADPDKVICKKFTKTGSLVQSTRTCKTRREWAKQSTQAQEDWGQLQGKGWTNDF
jgi:periplasmic protein TonB